MTNEQTLEPAKIKTGEDEKMIFETNGEIVGCLPPSNNVGNVRFGEGRRGGDLKNSSG
jgi:hypothetical protein